MIIVGLRIEKYIDKRVEGSNCNFKYYDDIFERHIICGVLTDNTKVEITLEQSEGECGSGWCTASFSEIKIKKVDKFEGYSYIPKDKNLEIDDIAIDFKGDELSNKVFTYSNYGGDDYYPSGGYTVKMDLFKETKRIHKNRPVWIFKGDSNSGKSFLSSKIQRPNIYEVEGLNVYETDISDKLLENITQDIIVLGNKYPHTIEDIKKNIFGDYNLIYVNFENTGEI